MIAVFVINIMALSCQGPIALYENVENAVDDAHNKSYLTVSTMGGGDVYPSGTVELLKEESKAVDAAAAEGCTFVQWRVISGNAIVEDPNAHETVITLLDKKAEVRALFSSSLTVNTSAGGTTDPSGKVLDVTIGDSYEIEATPNEGYYFEGWTATSGMPNFRDSEEQTTFVALTDGAATVRADFTNVEYELALSNDGHGTTVPSGTRIVSYGAEEEIQAEPADGYTFAYWGVIEGEVELNGEVYSQGEEINSNNISVVLENGNAHLCAYFDKKTYQLTVSSNNTSYGTVEPSGTTLEVEHGEPFTISASPNFEDGYEFDRWELTGNVVWDIGNGSEMETADIVLYDGPAEARAVFVPQEYSVTIRNREHCVSYPGHQSVISVLNGESTSVNVVSSESGFYFDHWEQCAGDGVAEFSDPSSPSTSVTIRRGDVTIQPIAQEGILIKVLAWLNNYETVYPATGCSISIYTAPSYTLKGITFYFNRWIVTEGEAHFQNYSDNSTNASIYEVNEIGVVKIEADY